MKYFYALMAVLSAICTFVAMYFYCDDAASILCFVTIIWVLCIASLRKHYEDTLTPLAQLVIIIVTLAIQALAIESITIRVTDDVSFTGDSISRQQN